MSEAAAARVRRLGDFDVFPIGLGAMPMSLGGRPDEAQSIRTIQAAVDAGVNLIDTADAYALGERDVGHNEELIARALDGRRDGVLVATKGGHTRRGTAWELDGRPEHLRAACEASLRRLRTDRIDLYQYHRPDPDAPFAESIGALRDLQDDGLVRLIGISNVSVSQLEEALAIAPIASVQNQLSLGYTGPLAKGEVEACTERDIAFLPWSPLGGIGSADSSARIDGVRRVASDHGVSPQQIALAWLLSLGPTVIPIPGASRPETILDSIGAADVRLSDEELAALGRGG
jgi:aryl-alcohol dehydrogenase-like predicted oxidoreductase